MSEGEIWKDVVGYEGIYKVSDRGNVFSAVRRDSNGRKCGGRIMKPIQSIGGYLRISLYKNGVEKRKLVHRLVAEAFIPNPENHPAINHRDEVKTNNELSNLEWCDARYNNNYGTRTERVSKKVRAVNVETGEVLTFNSTQEAVRKGYSSGPVSRACRGVYKTVRGKLIGDGHTYRGHRWYYIKEGE